MDGCASPACGRTSSGATLAFAVLVSSLRFLTCTPSDLIVPNVVSTLFGIVEIVRTVSKVPLLCECLAALSLPYLHESESSTELRVPELTRK